MNAILNDKINIAKAVKYRSDKSERCTQKVMLEFGSGAAKSL
jgi:hypothetical protein